MPADQSRLSIYAGPPITEVLAGFNNRSGRLNAVCERYAAIVEDELRRASFTRAEWCAICDALNGAQIEVLGAGTSWELAWASVADSADEMNAKWGVLCEDIARRVQAMSVAGRAAVWEVAARFWCYSEVPIDEALARAGVPRRVLTAPDSI